MTTTAHEDQFTAAPEPVREPMSREAILRRSVADLELALKQQTERAEAAEAELAKLREQKPVRWHVRGNYFRDGDAAILFASMNSMCGAKVDQLFAAPVPALAVPEDWRNIIIEMVEWWDDQHMTLAQGRAIWNKARALLQSAEVQAGDKLQLTPAPTHPVDRNTGDVRHD